MAMKAMTMMFQVAPGVALDDVRPGAEVDFWVKEENGTYTVTEIRRSGSLKARETTRRKLP